MVVKYYRGAGPGTILLIIFTGALVWLQPLINRIDYTDSVSAIPMPLARLLQGILLGNPVTGLILAFLLVFVIGFYLVNFNTRLFFITERTFLPASVYIIYSGFLPDMQKFSMVIPATLLLIIAFDKVMAAYRKSGIAYNFFDASLLIGIASMLYFNIIWFYIIVLAGIAILRTFNIRELAVSVFGLVAPYIVVYAGYYIKGLDLALFTDIIITNIISEEVSLPWTPLRIIAGSVNLLVLIIFLVHLLSVFNKKKVRSRRTFYLLLWMMVISVVIYLIIPGVSAEVIYILLVPYAYLASHFIVFSRNKKIANVLFAILFLSVLVIQLEKVLF